VQEKTASLSDCSKAARLARAKACNNAQYCGRMQAILAVTIPFFALVLLGWFAARAYWLPESAIPGLNAYVLFFALPCMLFRFGSSLPIGRLADPVLLAVYVVSALAIIALTIAVTVRRAGRSNGVTLRDAAFGALVAAFPNAGFMGVPLLVALLGENAAGPVIGTDAFSVTELGNGATKVSGLYVSDTDATASTDTFTVSAATGNVGSSVTPSTGTGSGLGGINATLNSGIIYDPHSPQPQTDSVTLTVADSHGHTDRVHFIFNQGGTGPNVALTGTSGKDIIFATDHADTLTGGVSADQFVFAPETSPSADTITDFKAGEDHIDLRAFSLAVDSSTIGTWLGAHAAASGVDTLITFNENGDSITLRNVAVASLHASDFIVSPHH